MAAVFCLLIVSVTLAATARLSLDGLAHLNRSPSFVLLMDVLVGGVILLPAMYFSRVQSPGEFWKACGLYNFPTNLLWLGALIAGFIQFVHIGVDFLAAPQFAAVFAPPSATPTSRQISRLLSAVIISPVWEEIVMRGFLYKAFRGTYSVRTSMCLMAAIMVVTHPSQTFSSLTSVCAVTAVSIALCWLRERSPSLWDCILLHSVYNGIYVIANLSRL